MSDQETVRDALVARGQSEWFVLDAFDRLVSSRADLLAALERLQQGVVKYEPGLVLIDSGAWSFAVGILRAIAAAHQGEEG